MIRYVDFVDEPVSRRIAARIVTDEPHRSRGDKQAIDLLQMNPPGHDSIRERLGNVYLSNRHVDLVPRGPRNLSQGARFVCYRPHGPITDPMDEVEIQSAVGTDQRRQSFGNSGPVDRDDAMAVLVSGAHDWEPRLRPARGDRRR